MLTEALTGYANAQRRYRQGAIDYLNVLSVQRALLEAENDLAQGSALVSRNLVAFCKALGGDWEDSFPAPHCPGRQRTIDRGDIPCTPQGTPAAIAAGGDSMRRIFRKNQRLRQGAPG